MAIDIIINMFIKSKVDKYMQALDFGDGGMKLFGQWHCIEGTAKRLSAKTKEELTLSLLQKNDEVYFCSVNDVFAFKSKDIIMFSSGKVFSFVSEIRDKLLTEGYREIEYKEVDSAVDINDVMKTTNED